MTSPTKLARPSSRLRVALGAMVLLALGASASVDAQVVQGVEKGAREGNKAAGAIGGVVGVVTGVTGVLTGGGKGGGQPQGQQPQAKDAKQGDAAKTAKATKGAKGTKQAAVLTQTGVPTLTAEQIVASSDANIERIKTELSLTPEQEKHWAGFNSAMHYLGHNGADRLNLRIARAKRDPPDDIIEQMRNEAQFLNDRAVDQRNVADA